jgi:hypothetical protein
LRAKQREHGGLDAVDALIELEMIMGGWMFREDRAPGLVIKEGLWGDSVNWGTNVEREKRKEKREKKKKMC